MDYPPPSGNRSEMTITIQIESAACQSKLRAFQALARASFKARMRGPVLTLLYRIPKRVRRMPAALPRRLAWSRMSASFSAAGKAGVMAVIEFASRFAHSAMRRYRGIRMECGVFPQNNEQRSLPHCAAAHWAASARRIARPYAAHRRRVLGHRARGPRERTDLHQARIAQTES